MSVPPDRSREQQLVLEVLAVSHEHNPTYTQNQHLAWALGILAETVLRKNHMDNIVYARLNHKLNTLIEQDKYETNHKSQTKRP